jgi:predicted PurR-regulated permease PerM
MGVLGVAFIQAIVTGLVMMLAAIPFAGLLAMVLLVLGVAQIPALLVTLPAIAYIWMSGSHEHFLLSSTQFCCFSQACWTTCSSHCCWAGVDAPMPIILIGALGGLANTGILGMFVGATLLALVYQIFMWWVANDPNELPTENVSPTLE